MDDKTTFEVWRRSDQGETLVMSDESETQVKDWYLALTEQEKVNRKKAEETNTPRPLIRYDLYTVTVVRRKVRT